MTRNDHPNKLEWSIRPRSGVDSAQWEWGISIVVSLHSIILLMAIQNTQWTMSSLYSLKFFHDVTVNTHCDVTMGR